MAHEAHLAQSQSQSVADNVTALGTRIPTAPPADDLRAEGEAFVIDCDHCGVRGTSCGDCMVTVLLGGPPYGVPLDDDERRALEVLATAGLIPPLRMVQAQESRFIEPP
ncbi:MAG: hypothetical protein ACRDQA_15855 [Nocardioidaceae bacterium]